MVAEIMGKLGRGYRTKYITNADRYAILMFERTIISTVRSRTEVMAVKNMRPYCHGSRIDT